ncbi:dual specificity mitogen-activated protein kinase kinase 5 isoform X2 [Lingula anatina]|uniref:mitogen-activated protein kinase kinase n=1 Tax=Lingula anatina TaxID=7574 RepID=A0A1S3K0B2_LINAN|nr:dual specificity mitogen-activated protein kinase kinase 5 isoform X2 [Lingula anatina]|eukprot:XP_013415711.1 dual specificity mitogen-activated protein kinase kinase 5 isoform X2 [Lingula anatina]
MDGEPLYSHLSRGAVMTRVVPHASISAFDYEDEDGDKITVRSDDEMKTMIVNYLNSTNEIAATSGNLQPLVIFPRASKSSDKRNIHGLKVKTKSPNAVPAGDPGIVHGSRKQQASDLQEILACGHISDAHLHYIEILGSGNGGTVYRAQHRPSGTIMAVKVIPLDITPEIQQQIISELEVLYKSNSPMIIGFYGAYFIENRISICTEFMDGGSLDKYGQIPETVLGRMAVAVVKGLHYLWNLKIMHRDVKPSNILVNTQGHVKLCDFGVSVQLVTSIARTYVGTNVYMAPERLEGNGYSIHSEVWSFGLSLCELAVGRFPYKAPDHSNSAIGLLNTIVKEPPPRLPDGIFSEGFIDFVALCMQKDPTIRPAPRDLLQHPFIVKNDDGNTEIIAAWVGAKLQQIQLRRIAHATSSA